MIGWIILGIGIGMSDRAMYYLCIFYVIAGRRLLPLHRDLKIQRK